MTSKTLTREEYLALSPQDALEYALFQAAHLTKQMPFASPEAFSSIMTHCSQWTLYAHLLKEEYDHWKVLCKYDRNLAALVKQQLIAIHHESADNVFNVTDTMEIMYPTRTTQSSTTAYHQSASHHAAATTPTTPTPAAASSTATETLTAIDSPHNHSESNVQPTSHDASPTRPDRPELCSDFCPYVPANDSRSANPGVLKHGCTVPGPRPMSTFCDPDDDTNVEFSTEDFVTVHQEDQSWHGMRVWDPP